MNEQTNDQSTDQTTAADEIEALLRGLLSLGCTWANYGLEVGKLALQTHANALGIAADTLTQLSRSVRGLGDRVTDSKPSAT